jgi:hypothetical protein
MKNILILIYFLPLINGKLKLTTSYICKNCFGKIHKYQELELTKQSLIINKNDICLNQKYKFMIIVKSGNFKRRNLTRSTWAKDMIEHFNIPILYAIGYPNDSSIQNDIFLENKIYNDLLQFTILESYYNLTLKTTSVLIWYNKYCSNSSNYLFYVDDDILIHVDKFIIYINEFHSNNAIAGWFEESGPIQRTGIGGISKENFPIDLTPDYLWGAAVLYPTNVISNGLINSIFNTTLPIFFRDDVFINGFIAEQAGITRKHMNGILLYNPTEDDLKYNMIIIDFKTEEDRLKAWNCYKYNIQCNKNLPLLLFKIFSGIFLVIIISIFCWKYWKTTRYFYYIKYEFNCWYYGINYPYRNNMNSGSTINKKQRSTIGAKLGIQWLINLRRIWKRIIFIFILVVIIILYCNSIFLDIEKNKKKPLIS